MDQSNPNNLYFNESPNMPELGDKRDLILAEEIDRNGNARTVGVRQKFDGTEWRDEPCGQWVKYRAPSWLTGTPVETMREFGVETDPKSAQAFMDASDSNFESLYYLGIAALDGVGVEALKWIMSNMLAELNVRKLPFTELGTLVPATVLNNFLATIQRGGIDRSFAKPVFAELTKETFGPGDNGDDVIGRLANDPRFKAADESVIDDALDTIIAANPEQFEKARENPKLIQWFVGQAMKATQGKAKPPVVIAKMEKRLAA